ncbi:DUF4167 domain-containing protein [Inquilinus sp. NPDC058860]|uniref:DUF4167 domain-containing protein n=1 Tax=Inquilinus sp. NPDC058860 TaxID=3346652 RepID=UPI0036907356
MRPGPNSRRARGRNGGGGGGGGGGGSQQRRPNALPNRNQTIDSNGPDIRIRGNVFQVYDKYMGLARDAQASGDRVMAENYQQHAEHYVRIINAMNEAYGGQPHQPGGGQDSSREQPGVDADYDPLTSPPPQRRDFEARNEGGDRQQRREYEPREGGDRPRREFEGRGEGGDRPPRREFEGRGDGDRQNRDQGYRDRDPGFRDNRPPRDQGPRDQNRDRDQGQRDRFGSQRDGRPDYRNERPQPPAAPDVNAPQPHIPSPLDPAPVDLAASSASFGADPRDQEDSGLDTELALPASIIARPRRGRPPRAAAPAEAAPPDQPAPAAPAPAPAQPPQPEASAQPGLPGVAAEEAPAPAPKRRPGRPRKVKAAEETTEPSSGE